MLKTLYQLCALVCSNRRLLLALVLLTSSVSAMAQSTDDADFLNSLVPNLTSKKIDDRLLAIESIATSGLAPREQWLQAILDGQMYLHKADKKLVIAEKSGKLYAMTDPVTGESLGEDKKRALSKIKINNAIRTKIKSMLGSLALSDADASTRLQAVGRLIGSNDESVVDVVRERLEVEADSKVAQHMQLLIAVYDLKNGDNAQRALALDFAADSLDQEMVNVLRETAVSDSDTEIRNKAAELLSKAERKLALYAHIETAFFGLSLGSVLVLAAIGLAITFGVMGVINMAHGELLMLGAYTTYFIQQLFPGSITYSLIIAVPAAFCVSGAVGVLIERGVIRHLYGRPLETLLATFGVSLILQQTVRTFVSSQNVAVINPSWMSGSWEVNAALSLTMNRLVIVAFCFAVFAFLLIIFTRSRFGLQMRAVAQNRQMARAMGIKSSRIDALTFGLGSGIAGVAGVALSQLGNVGPNLGQNYIIDSFMVVVFGGVGNLWGTLVAGLSLGIANKFAEPWAGAVMAKILILVFIILFIQSRPRGLFPQTGRASED